MRNPSCVSGYHFCTPSFPCRDCEKAEARNLREEVRRLNLQISELKAEAGRYAMGMHDADARFELAVEKLKETDRLYQELQNAVAEMLEEMRAGGTPEFFKAQTRVETLIERPKGPCNCYAIEGRAHLTDCPQYAEKRVRPACFLCGKEAVGKIGAEPRCEAHA